MMLSKIQSLHNLFFKRIIQKKKIILLDSCCLLMNIFDEMDTTP